MGLSLPKKKEVIVYTSLTKQQKAYYEGAARTLMVCNVLTCVDRMLVGLLGEGHAHFRRPTDRQTFADAVDPSGSALWHICRPTRENSSGRPAQAGHASGSSPYSTGRLTCYGACRLVVLLGLLAKDRSLLEKVQGTLGDAGNLPAGRRS